MKNYRIILGMMLTLGLSLVGPETFAQPGPPPAAGPPPAGNVVCTGCVGSTDIADGGVAAVDINTSQVQTRVGGICSEGSSIRAIDVSGTVVCETDDNSGGAVTGVTASAPLVSSGGTTPNISLPGVLIDTNNTAVGSGALLSNTTGAGNTASGVEALLNNTDGFNNTVSGFQALRNNTTGNSNTASGIFALRDNTTGSINTASGTEALLSNTTGNVNTATGVGALHNNTTGSNNTASGIHALENNTTGFNNTAIGQLAGPNLTTGNGNIAIGNAGLVGEEGEEFTTRIGFAQTRAFITGIRDVTTGVADAVAVVVDSAGQLGTLSSSQRVKDDIADMGEASSMLMKLRPVTFYYKADQNSKGRSLQYGLVAEEVAAVAPGLVARKADGEIETVFYQHLPPMLLNEYQKQQRILEAQAAALKQQTAEVARQTARVAALEQERRMQTARIEVLEQQAARVAVTLGRLEQSQTVANAGR